ncbi:hypothetical protein BGZ76_002798 [Entomortierella beljakovae]|nr:hypothetical protein BGZ76_002798 [Entomortierella beljakovae]
MILENDEERYEISLQHHAGTDARRFDQYRFAVISPRTSLSSWSKASYPLPPSCLSEVLYEDLDWQDFEWVERGVVVQPSQKSKQTHIGSGSMMEGIETTGQSSVANSAGQSNVKNGEPDGRTTTDAVPGNSSMETLSSEPTMTKSHDSQQDGVFCVVSRLFWRPITEKPLNLSTLHQQTDKSKAESQDTPVKGTITDLPAPKPDTKSAVDAPPRRAGSYGPEIIAERKSEMANAVNAVDIAPTSSGSALTTADHEMTATSYSSAEPRLDAPNQPRQDDSTVSGTKEDKASYEEGELEDGEIASE